MGSHVVCRPTGSASDVRDYRVDRTPKDHRQHNPLARETRNPADDAGIRQQPPPNFVPPPREIEIEGEAETVAEKS